MSTIKPCTCGAEPGMMYNRMTDDSLYFFMKCKACGRRGRSNADVNLAVDDWNERIGGQMERCYGAFKAFNHKPSEEEIAAAKEEIAEKLKQYIISDAHWIVKGPGYLCNTEYGIISADSEEHTIGFKIVFDADVESVVHCGK